MQEHPLLDKSGKNTFDVLWVGKMDFCKQLGLALKSVAKSGSDKLRLHIVGGGDAESYQLLAESYGIADKCIWHGAVSHDEVQDIMQKSDVFLFTSVAEGTPHVVLEAIGNNLPVVCFDTCGQGDAVNDKVGRKVPLSSPSQSARDFATILNEFEGNRNLLKQMSENCKQRQIELSWEEKAKTMVGWYEKIVHNR